MYIEEKGTFGGPSDDLEKDSLSAFAHLFRNWGGTSPNLLWYHLENGDPVLVDAVNNNIDPATNMLKGLSSVAGVENASVTHVLVRKANVKKGNLKWDNALLSSIRRPDIPFLLDSWKGDTIPNFNINCWNEWTGGSYLEPDVVNGMAYLEAIQEVFGGK